MEFWLDKVMQLDREGQVDDAIDIVYENMDELLLDGKYQAAGEILEHIECDQLSEYLLIAFATITLTKKKIIPKRDDFMARVRDSLRRRGTDDEEIDDLLAGL